MKRNIVSNQRASIENHLARIIFQELSSQDHLSTIESYQNQDHQSILSYWKSLQESPNPGLLIKGPLD